MIVKREELRQIRNAIEQPLKKLETEEYPVLLNSYEEWIENDSRNIYNLMLFINTSNLDRQQRQYDIETPFGDVPSMPYEGYKELVKKYLMEFVADFDSDTPDTGFSMQSSNLSDRMEQIPDDAHDWEYKSLEIRIFPEDPTVEFVDYEKRLNERSLKGLRLVEDGVSAEQAVRSLELEYVDEQELRERILDRVEDEYLTRYIAEAYRNNVDNVEQYQFETIGRPDEKQVNRIKQSVPILDNLTDKDAELLQYNI